MTASVDATQIAATLPTVLADRDRHAVERLLAPDVRWGSQEETAQTCHDRDRAGDTYAALLAAGVHLHVLDTHVDENKVLAHLAVIDPRDDGTADYHLRVLLTVQNGLVDDILQLDDDEPPSTTLQ